MPTGRALNESPGGKARLLPSMLVAARQLAMLRQKEVALEAGLDQSYVCALERGRRQVPRPDVLDALCRGLKLGSEECRQLHWAASHDRVLAAVSDEGLTSYAPLVSAALRAAHYLGPGELAGLERQVLRSIQSKQQLLALEAEALRSAPEKENTMT